MLERKNRSVERTLLSFPDFKENHIDPDAFYKAGFPDRCFGRCEPDRQKRITDPGNR